jgi:hypothetical protein
VTDAVPPEVTAALVPDHTGAEPPAGHTSNNPDTPPPSGSDTFARSVGVNVLIHGRFAPIVHTTGGTSDRSANGTSFGYEL